MDVNWGSRAAAWDAGCQTDPVRNNFVIPYVSDVISARSPRRVIDVGCGTGYIVRSLAKRHAAAGIEWVLLDSDYEMLHYAAKQCRDWARVSLVRADVSAQASLAEVNPADLVCVAFTTMEFPMNAQIAENMSGLVTEGGALVLFVPDVIRDIVKSSSAIIHLTSYLSGYCFLTKIDKFSGCPYPFHATRVETLISYFTHSGLVLRNLETSPLAPDGADPVLAFTFEKPVA